MGLGCRVRTMSQVGLRGVRFASQRVVSTFCGMFLQRFGAMPAGHLQPPPPSTSVFQTCDKAHDCLRYRVYSFMMQLAASGPRRLLFFFLIDSSLLLCVFVGKRQTRPQFQRCSWTLLCCSRPRPVCYTVTGTAPVPQRTRICTSL